jgi:hypothetical protein
VTERVVSGVKHSLIDDKPIRKDASKNLKIIST